MKPLSILFYVEPVMYHCNPSHLEAWVNLVAGFCVSARTVQIGFASGPWLCRQLATHEGTSACRLFEISPREILAPFAFDRHVYGADLYRAHQYPEVNHPLADALRRIANQTNPDIIVCFTQNRYIESIFARRRTLFMEMGPMPRIAGRLSFFMDPSGHQTASLLNMGAQRILNMPLDDHRIEMTLHLWQEHIVKPARQNPAGVGLSHWLDRARAGRKVALFALQSPDSPTYEAAYGKIEIDNLIMRWLQDLPEGWAAVPVHHPSFAIPRTAEETIAIDFPSLLPMPSELVTAAWQALPTWTGLSEFLLPWVDGIVTLSSSVGIHGLLHGKSVVTHGLSSMMTLAHRALTPTPTLNDGERMRLLAFLTHRYCQPYDLCLNDPEYLMNIFSWLVETENPCDSYFDLEGWSPDRVSAFTSKAMG